MLRPGINLQAQVLSLVQILMYCNELLIESMIIEVWNIPQLSCWPKSQRLKKVKLDKENMTCVCFLSESIGCPYFFLSFLKNGGLCIGSIIRH